MLATTRQFLDDLGLASLEQLPTLGVAGSPAEMLVEAMAEQPSLIDPQADLALDAGAAEPPAPMEPHA